MAQNTGSYGIWLALTLDVQWLDYSLARIWEWQEEASVGNWMHDYYGSSQQGTSRQGT